MLRVTFCCNLCPRGFVKNGYRSFSNSQSKWKGWSGNSKQAIKPASEELEQEVQQFDLSRLKSENIAVSTASFKDGVHRRRTLPGNSSENFPKTPQHLLHSNYFPTTVAEVVQSVKNPYSSPLKLLNMADPDVVERSVKLNPSELLKCYLGLSKSRLTGLVVVTAMAGYALAPAPFVIGPFIAVSLGTALTSAAANTVNQIVEVPYDSKMNRTKNRVLVKEKLSKEHAAAFAVISGMSGLTLLTLGANGLTAALGGLNLLLYTCVYTPMKRQSIANTWVGSVVGGIPPLMGWAACTGELTHGALLLGGILYAWQFPHFNALSWNIKDEYSKAGYKMMASTHPELCRKTSLRYSLSLILISSLAPVCSVTSWTFVIDSLPLNGYLVYLAYKFYQEGDSASSRKLFRFSLIHLPTLILLMMVSKQAYKDKTVECPMTAAINEVTSTSLPPVPAVFSSVSSDSSKSTNVNFVESKLTSELPLALPVNNSNVSIPPS